MNRNDLRYVKTEETLKKALLHLLRKNKLEDISIKALCTEAKCSRNAFYQHYQTKHDLFNSIMNDMLTVIVDSARPKIIDKKEINERVIKEYTYRLLDIIAAHKNELKSLSDGKVMILTFLSDSLYQAFLQHYSLVADKEKITEQEKLITKYFACGIAGFVELWIKNNDIQIEDARQYLDLCTRDNLRRMRDLLLALP